MWCGCVCIVWVVFVCVYSVCVCVYSVCVYIVWVVCVCVYSRGGKKNRLFDSSRFSLERFCLDSEKFIIDFLINLYLFFLHIHLLLKCKRHQLLHCSLKVIVVTRKSFFSNKKMEKVINLLIFFNYQTQSRK